MGLKFSIFKRSPNDGEESSPAKTSEDNTCEATTTEPTPTTTTGAIVSDTNTTGPQSGTTNDENKCPESQPNVNDNTVAETHDIPRSSTPSPAEESTPQSSNDNEVKAEVNVIPPEVEPSIVTPEEQSSEVKAEDPVQSAVAEDEASEEAPVIEEKKCKCDPCHCNPCECGTHDVSPQTVPEDNQTTVSSDSPTDGQQESEQQTETFAEEKPQESTPESAIDDSIPTNPEFNQEVQASDH